MARSQRGRRSWASRDYFTAEYGHGFGDPHEIVLADAFPLVLIASNDALDGNYAQIGLEMQIE